MGWASTRLYDSETLYDAGGEKETKLYVANRRSRLYLYGIEACVYACLFIHRNLVGPL